MTDGKPVVSVRSASFGYAGRTVVRDLTFDIGSGEVVAILGPNGSGKSTAMKGLLGLSDLTGGTFDLFGVPGEKFRDRTLVGYVPQRHSLTNSVTATVREIVEVGRLPHRKWWQHATARDAEAVDAALATVGLSDRARFDVSNLSGGQQRRVLIARALAGQPEMLIMDEPTAGVDVASQEVLAGVLKRLAASGATLLIVTHELEALRGIVTRIIEISHGTLDFDGTPDQWASHESERIHAASAHRALDAHHLGEDPHDHGDRATIGTGPLDLHGTRPQQRGSHHHG